MKKNNLFIVAVAAIFLLASITITTIPSLKLATGLGNLSYFNVTLTISNTAPTITYVKAISASPTEGTASNVEFTFNASDANGAGDIPASNADVVINRSGVTRTSGPCYIKSTSGITNMYICNVTVNYWDLPGTWTINASVYDGASAIAENRSIYLTMGTTYAIALKTTSLTFSGSPGATGVGASNNPQFINNTGNGAFSSTNITAFNLLGGSNYIDAANFTINTTNTQVGHIMLNNTPVKLYSSNLSVQSLLNLYVYMQIPNGTTNATYTSSSSWLVTME